MPDPRSPARTPTPARGTSFDPTQATSNVDSIVSLLSSLGLTDPLGVSPPDLQLGSPPPTIDLDKLLGRVFSTPNHESMPPLRLTSGDPETRTLQFHGTNGPESGTAFESSYDDVGKLLKKGTLAPEPASIVEGKSIEQMVRKLLSLTRRMRK